MPVNGVPAPFGGELTLNDVTRPPTLTADLGRVEGLVPAEGVAMEPCNAAAGAIGITVPPTAAE